MRDSIKTSVKDLIKNKQTNKKCVKDRLNMKNFIDISMKNLIKVHVKYLNLACMIRIKVSVKELTHFFFKVRERSTLA